MARLTLKNIGQSLLDKTDLDEKLQRKFKSARINLKTGVDNIRHAVQNPNNPFDSAKSFSQNIPYVQRQGQGSLANFSLNTAKPFFSGISTAGRGIDSVRRGRPIQGAAQIVKGAGQAAAPFTPTYQLANYVGSSPDPRSRMMSPQPKNLPQPPDRMRRFAAGFMRGVGQDKDIASNIKTKQALNIPGIGAVDPLTSAGEMVGFVKNPVNARIFKATEAILPAKLYETPVRKWLAITSARGGLEGLMLGLAEIPENTTPHQKLNFLAKEMGKDAVFEIFGRGFFDSLGKSADVVKHNQVIDNVIDQLRRGSHRLAMPVSTMRIDPKTGRRIQMPLWQYELNKRGFGLSTKDINELSPEDYTKAGGNINRYLKNAYKVYSGQKPYQVVAKISNDVAKKTGYEGYQDITVKQAFFDKIIEGHPNIFKDPKTGEVNKQRLFSFVRTLNIPDEIRQAKPSQRLNYFRELENKAVNLVVIDKDLTPPTNLPKSSTTITDFTINPNKPKRANYLKSIKNTSDEVFSRSGGTDTGYPSSNMPKASARNMGPLNFPGPQTKDIISQPPQADSIKIRPQEATGKLKVQPLEGQTTVSNLKTGAPTTQPLEGERLKSQPGQSGQLEAGQISQGGGVFDSPSNLITRVKARGLKVDSQNLLKQGGVKVKPKSNQKIRLQQSEEAAIKEAEAIVAQSLSDSGARIPGSPSGGSSKLIVPDNKYAFNINKNKLNLKAPEKEVLDKVVNQVTPELEKAKGKRLSNKEVIEAAKKSEMLQQVTSREETLKANAAMLKARQRMVELDKQITREAVKGNQKAVEKNMKELIDSLRVVSAEAADRGRKLQSLAIQAEDESIRTTILKEISKTETDTEKIIKEAASVDWENANSVAKFYRKFIKPSLREILDEYRYNNMLSSPRTQLRNSFSNLVQAYITRPATIAATGDIKGTAKYYQGALSSLPKAKKAFVDAFSGNRAVEKPDLEYIPTLKLPRFMTIPSRALEAGDKFFSTIIREGELARGTSKTRAEEIAAYSLFRQDLKPKGQGKLLNVIDDLTEGVYSFGNKFPAFRWFVPFVRTPMNFAKQWVEYSPMGIATLPGAANKKEQLAKTLLGSAVTLMGAQLALEGNTTWAAPTDPKEKELFYASGRKPFSVKIGDKWVSMMYAGPYAYALALPAALSYYQTENRTALTDNQLEKMGKVVASMAEFLSGQTFLEGIDNFVSLLKGDVDYSFSKNLAYTSGQMIPLQGLVRYITTAIDPVYRKAQGPLEQFQSGLPFISQSLTPYTDPTGKPSERERKNLITPYDVSTEKPEWNDQLDSRQNRLQSNAVVNKMKKDFEAGKPVVSSTTVSNADEDVIKARMKYGDLPSVHQEGNHVFYTRESDDSIQKIDLSWEPQAPKLTGNAELDKKLMSKYKGEVTSKKNDIVKLYELGFISANEAEELLAEIDKKSGGSGKKPKKYRVTTNPPQTRIIWKTQPKQGRILNLSRSQPRQKPGTRISGFRANIAV